MDEDKEVLKHLLKTILDMEKEIKDLEKDVELKKSSLSSAKEFLVSEIGASGMTGFRDDKGCLASVKEKKSYTVKKEFRPKLYEWLRQQKLDSYIQESVHSGSLNTFFNESWIDKEGNEKPRPEWVKRFDYKSINITGRPK